MLPLLATLILAQRSDELTPLRTFASHSAMTKEQSALLTEPSRGLSVLANTLGCDILTDGPDTLIWPKNIYDLDEMEKCISSFSVLQRLMQEGRKSFKMSELAPDERESIRALIINNGEDLTFGAATYSDDLNLELSYRQYFDFEKNGKRVHALVAPPSGVFIPRDKRVSADDSNKDPILLEKMRRYKDTHQPSNTAQLTYFQFGRLASWRKLAAQNKLSNALLDKLKEQADAYTKAQISLRDKVPGKRHVVGERWDTMDPDLQKDILGSALANNMTESEMRRFCEGASVKSTYVEAAVTIWTKEHVGSFGATARRHSADP